MVKPTVTNVISVKDMRVYEVNAVWLGIPLLLLMENAGREVAQVIRQKLGGDLNGKEIVVFVGRGGNGGDGLVAARHLVAMGGNVSIILLYDPLLISSPDTLLNMKIIEKMDTSIKVIKVKEPDKLKPFNADALIDAMLGVGVRGKLREPIRTAVKIFNESTGLKVAVDVPTGVDPDTGKVADEAVKADVTITMYKLKPGLIIARKYVGEIVVAEIGIPPEAEIYVGPGDVKYRVPKKPVNAHKGVGGRVLVIGGSKLYSGAPALAAFAALRSGADLAFIVAPETVAKTIASFSPNLIVHDVKGEFFSPRNIVDLKEILAATRPQSIILGPGIGLSEETKEFVLEALDMLLKLGKSIVIDADALKHIAGTNIKLNEKTVLTPHMGELSKLLGVKYEDDTNDVNVRVKLCSEVSLKYNTVTLLKGPIDVICYKENYRLNKTGNPGMSVGGTGDVLTGIVAALMARGVDPYYAAQVAAYINGRAGDIAFQEFGERITAFDLVNYIPKVFIEVEEYPYKKTVLYDKQNS